MYSTVRQLISRSLDITTAYPAFTDGGPGRRRSAPQSRRPLRRLPRGPELRRRDPSRARIPPPAHQEGRLNVRSTPLISRPTLRRSLADRTNDAVQGDRCAQTSKYVEKQHDNENSVLTGNPPYSISPYSAVKRYSGKGDTTLYDEPPLRSAGRISSGAARRHHLVAVTPLDLGAMLTANRS